MKVFTVGLDQKPPVKDASSDPATEKSGGSPPPGYVAATNVKHIPLPMGPEIPLPPQPIVVRKSRGYKGILMVMLAVFLMALFALTLSEIAYNRQRDENFFRLRWAELKHRLGYGDNAFDYYHRANSGFNGNNERFFSLGRNKELAEALIQQTEPTTTAPPMSSSMEPVVAIDSFPPKPSSFEQQPDAMIRDARLQFLKTILQKIKQHAEDMGFDGTMQVSVIEVEPQGEGESFSPFGSHQQPHQLGAGNRQSFHPLLPNFFPHLPIEDQAPKPGSDAFLDGFGEVHQPTFMQNNQVVEQNRARAGPFGWPREDESQQQQGHQGDNFNEGPQWPRGNNNPFRPDFFQPMNNWQMFPPPPQAQQQQGFPQPPHILPRPPSFDRWSGGNQPQNQQQNNLVDGENDKQPPMIQIFPQHPPMLPPMMGQQNQQGFEGQKSNENGFQSGDSSNASPSQEVVGEIYGRKFGRMLQDIIANRIQGFHNLQQMNFVPPEDRIQVEPPQTPNQQPLVDGPMGPGPMGSGQRMSSAGNDDSMKGVVENQGPRGWTHQFPKSSSSSSQQQQPDNSEEAAAPQINNENNPEDQPKPIDDSTGGNSKSNSASNEQPAQSQSENDDVWLVAPPHRTQTLTDSSPSTPVDFPAVKFPMMTNNNDNNDNGAAPASSPKQNAAKPAEPITNPQNDQAQPLLSNPVFFQVDDPSVEQQQAPRALI